MKKLFTHTLSFIAGLISICIPIGMFTCCMDFDQAIEYRCDPELQPYLDKFYLEAEVRGVRIPKENLIMSIEPQKNIRGAANARRCGCQRLVLVADDTYDFFSTKWMSKDSAYYGMESVIFHELGHSLLDRRHDDIGLMQSGISYFVYVKDEVKRKELLDELFTQTKFGNKFNQY